MLRDVQRRVEGGGEEGKTALAAAVEGLPAMIKGRAEQGV